MSAFQDSETEVELRGMLASLLTWANDHAKTQCVSCNEAMKSLNPIELNLLMLYAPMMRMQSGKEFQQIMVDGFMNGDDDTAQMIIDVLQRYVDADDIDFVTTFDLVAKFKERSQISAPQLKQLLTLLVNIKAKEISERESMENAKEVGALESKPLDGLELRRREAELKVQELELQMENLKRSSKARLR